MLLHSISLQSISHRVRRRALVAIHSEETVLLDVVAIVVRIALDFCDLVVSFLQLSNLFRICILNSLSRGLLSRNRLHFLADDVIRTIGKFLCVKSVGARRIIVELLRAVARRLCLDETVLLGIDKATVLGMRLGDLHRIGELTLVESRRIAPLHLSHSCLHRSRLVCALRSVITHRVWLATLNYLLCHVDQLAVCGVRVGHLAIAFGITAAFHGVASLEL